MLNSLFSKIQFSSHKRPSQDKQRENFSKKLIKKFSRSADTLKPQDDLNSKTMSISAKEKSFSLTDAHFLNSIDDPLSSKNNNHSHSRFQTNFYRRFKGTKRQENVTQHSSDNLDSKGKQNKNDVVNRIVKHATFLKHDQQNNKNESQNVTKNFSDRQNESDESDDYDDDSIFVDDDGNDTSESGREEQNILINKTTNSCDDEDEELERQIFREIDLLDKTLEEYS